MHLHWEFISSTEVVTEGNIIQWLSSWTPAFTHSFDELHRIPTDDDRTSKCVKHLVTEIDLTMHVPTFQNAQDPATSAATLTQASWSLCLSPRRSAASSQHGSWSGPEKVGSRQSHSELICCSPLCIKARVLTGPSTVWLPLNSLVSSYFDLTTLGFLHLKYARQAPTPEPWYLLSTSPPNIYVAGLPPARALSAAHYRKSNSQWSLVSTFLVSKWVVCVTSWMI